MRKSLLYTSIFLGLGIAALSLVLIILFSSLREQSVQSQARGGENSAWYAHQIHYELLVFLKTLQDYHLEEKAVPHTELLTRFDVLWSRIDGARYGVVRERLDEVEGAMEVLNQTFKNLQIIEPLVLNLKPDDKAAFQTIRDTLEPALPPLRQISMAVLREQEAHLAESSLNVESAMRNLAWALIGMFILSAMLITMVTLEIRLVKRLYAELIIRNKILQKKIDERDKLETQLRRSQKLEAVGTLTSGISHDFNNILQIIKGYVQLSISKTSEDAPTAKYLDKILGASNRAAKLIQQLLAFNRQQASNPKHIKINNLVENLINMLRRVIGENIELNLSLDSSPLRTYADPGMLEQVLLNLCINARDAMPRGGKLTLSTQVFQADTQFCSMHEWASNMDYIVIEISDTGTGMSPEVMEHLFEPFYTTKDVGKGSGLGLSMAYGIIKQHDGHILFDSESGKGTTFKIFLPKKDEPVAQHALITKEEIPGGKETILIAEDDSPLLNLLVELLNKKGYHTLVASDGMEMLRIYRKNPSAIDLVIMDVFMPKMNGREAYMKIKKFRPSLPIVFCTGYPLDNLDKTFVDQEKINLIQKPFSSNDFYRVVRTVLDSSQGEHDLKSRAN